MSKIILMLLVVLLLFMAIPETDSVIINIYNPYRIAVGCEVKCDWDGKKYAYYNNIIVPGKGHYKLVVSKKYNNCEVWPKILW